MMWTAVLGWLLLTFVCCIDLDHYVESSAAPPLRVYNLSITPKAIAPSLTEDDVLYVSGYILENVTWCLLIPTITKVRGSTGELIQTVGSYRNATYFGDIAVDRRDRVYVSWTSQYVNAVVILTVDGQTIGALPSPPPLTAWPSGIRLDSRGHVWVAYVNTPFIIKYDYNGRPLTEIDLGQQTPIGLAIDHRDYIYSLQALPTLPANIYKYSPDGNLVAVLGQSVGVVGISISPVNGDIFGSFRSVKTVAQIIRFDRHGNRIDAWDIRDPALLGGPAGTYLDDDENLFVAGFDSKLILFQNVTTDFEVRFSAS